MGAAAAGPAPQEDRRSQVGGTRRAVAVVTAALTVAGCAAGQDAGTEQETPDVSGVGGAAGQVVLDDVFLESAGGVRTGETVALRAAVTNDGRDDDRLVSADSPAGRIALLGPDGAPAPDGIALPAGGQLDAVTGPVRMQLADSARAVPETGTLRVTFVFDRAGEVRLDVPVAAGTAPAQAGS